jgi:hypothetical protein
MGGAEMVVTFPGFLSTENAFFGRCYIICQCENAFSENVKTHWKNKRIWAGRKQDLDATT